MYNAVVTGYAVVTPLGLDAPGTWSALLSGTSGATDIKDEWANDLPVRIAARADDAFADPLPVRKLRRLDRYEQLALVAGLDAWNHAGAPDVDRDRLAVIIGTAVGGISTTVAQSAALAERGSRAVSPHGITMLMANGAAGWLSIELGARGGARTPISACASGSEAIAMGMSLIRSGSADVVICGGAEAPVGPLGLASFAATRALSTRNEDPSHASRPFDATRDGFVLGEGAALLVLESESHAKARGAEIRGVIAGASVTSDAIDIVKGDPQNQSRTMVAALDDAGMVSGDIDLIHAHATSTTFGDVAESQAILEVFGAAVPVTATKASTGHLLGASGALGAVFALQALDAEIIPPTINLTTVDPQVEIDIVRESRPLIGGHAAMVNAFGFGGHSACLVVTTAQ